VSPQTTSKTLPDFTRYLSAALAPSPAAATMSWQSYVDDQLIATKMITHAVICGHDGNIWAQSADFKVTADELKTLLSKYGDTGALAASGIVIAGTKYMFLSSTDKVLRGKKGPGGLHTIKTVQALIVCIYEEPIVPEQAATVTEKLGDYLISVGY
jgi:profilin